MRNCALYIKDSINSTVKRPSKQRGPYLRIEAQGMGSHMPKNTAHNQNIKCARSKRKKKRGKVTEKYNHRS